MLIYLRFLLARNLTKIVKVHVCNCYNIEISVFTWHVLVLFGILNYCFDCDCAGVRKGDRVAVYMPMITEMIVTLLACARLGVIHSVVVSIFSAMFHCRPLILPLLHLANCDLWALCVIHSWNISLDLNTWICETLVFIAPMIIVSGRCICSVQWLSVSWPDWFIVLTEVALLTVHSIVIVIANPSACMCLSHAGTVCKFLISPGTLVFYEESCIQIFIREHSKQGHQMRVSGKCDFQPVYGRIFKMVGDKTTVSMNY